MRRILAYWRAEQRTIGQGFVALLLASLGSLVAGIALGSITGTLEEFPGLMILLPAAIGMRGNIFGALGSRLGTSIHSGLFEPSLRREGVLYQNVYAATVLTLSISVVLGVLAKTFSVAFGVSSISLVDLVVISVLGGVISSLVVGAFTVLLSIQAHRHGWDMDSVSSPLVTAAGDVVTIPSLFVATFVVNIKAVTSVVAISTIILAVALTARGLVTDLPATRRVLRESLLLLAIAGTINLFAGLVVEARLDRFVTFPALLVLIPPFLGAAGALVLLDFTIIFLFAALTFALAGVSAHVASAIVGLASPGVLTVVGISMFAGLIATIAAVWVAYYSAVVTFRRGLDPDNFGIPLITSTLDFVGVIALIIALVTFGVA
jgi:mgtE-like transporter